MTEKQTRGLTAGGLILIAALLCWPPVTPWGMAAAVPAAGLALAALRPSRRWGGWVTVLMIPYLGAAAMNILAGPMDQWPALLFGVATISVGLGGLDWLRRTGTSLRS